MSSAHSALPAPTAIRSATEHLALELHRLDQVIRRRIHLLRAEAAALSSGNETTQDPSYIADAEVDALVGADLSRAEPRNTQWDARIAAIEQSIARRVAASESQGVTLPLHKLAQIFSLSWLEQQALIVCLAPELRRKYDRLYAYLQDDVARRRPSIDLLLDLFVDDEAQRWQARTLLDANSALLRHRLVQQHDDSQSPSGSSALAAILQIDSRILQYLLGNNAPDTRVANLMQLVEPSAMVSADGQQVESLVSLIQGTLQGVPTNNKLLINLHGPDAAAQRDVVLAVCSTLKCSLIIVDGAALLAELPQNEWVLRWLGRESLLLQAPLFIANLDPWFADNAAASSSLSRLVAMLGEHCGLCFSGATQAWPAQRLPQTVALFNVEQLSPTAAQREQLWVQALHAHNLPTPAATMRSLAADYRLSAAQIRAAAMQIQALTPAKQQPVSLPPWPVLSGTCRSVSHRGLQELGVRVATKYCWDDLILPAPVKGQLHSICRQVRHHRRVFEDWGFGDKLAYGRALSVLFSGSPGTGKTMAAQVLAKELQQDLFKIDLSGVVSKYIGETEKNLNRVFNEAQTSNAILFFDEADALFGKRTEVADAHDRYANIEVSYLLQKMEEYDGIVMLATNFRNNMDDAFVRRIRFIVDFPFPDECGRAQIWRQAIPQRTPLAQDVDFDWLAAKIKIAGGSIKNVVLNAAFSAAHDGAPLGMAHLLQSCRYEFQKIGKLWDEKSLAYGVRRATALTQLDVE